MKRQWLMRRNIPFVLLWVAFLYCFSIHAKNMSLTLSLEYVLFTYKVLYLLYVCIVLLFSLSNKIGKKWFKIKTANNSYKVIFLTCVNLFVILSEFNPLQPGVVFHHDVFRGYRKALPGCNGLSELINFYIPWNYQN